MQQVHLDKRTEPVVFLNEEMFSNAHPCLESTVMKVSAGTVDEIFEVSILIKICVLNIIMSIRSMQSDEFEGLFEVLVSSNSHKVGGLLSGAVMRKYPDIAIGRWHISFDQLFQWRMWPNFIELIRKDNKINL